MGKSSPDILKQKIISGTPELATFDEVVGVGASARYQARMLTIARRAAELRSIEKPEGIEAS